MTDTIFALSSGQPPAAIALVRLSGPAAMATATMLAGSLPPPRQAALRTLRNHEGAVLDRALVIVFPGPRTLSSLPGCRAAVAGEFTRRALAAGRIDLAEAEGLGDLLEAETEAQRVAALAAVEGVVSREVRGWLATVAGLSARIEAILDHADEDDVDDGGAVVAGIVVDVGTFAAMLARVLASPPVERLRDGVSVVIAGPPNAGKSTLLNLLSERDAAIVSPVAGTTRDRIEAAVVRRGVAYRLLDTAGLTQTDDLVEAIGIDRAHSAIVAADLLLWLGDEEPPRGDALWIFPRSDLAGRECVPPGPTLAVREDDPATIGILWDTIEQRVAALLPRADALPLRARHRALIEEVLAGLASPSSDPVILGEQLRQGRTSLAAITGADATELMLDALFTRFCIGK